eukprot:6910252-Prymnesium_polylepis.1
MNSPLRTHAVNSPIVRRTMLSPMRTPCALTPMCALLVNHRRQARTATSWMTRFPVSQKWSWGGIDYNTRVLFECVLASEPVWHAHNGSWTHLGYTDNAAVEGPYTCDAKVSTRVAALNRAGLVLGRGALSESQAAAAMSGHAPVGSFAVRVAPTAHYGPFTFYTHAEETGDLISIHTQRTRH